MHLLNTKTYERINVEEELGQRPEYAILSHRWEGEEIKFKNYNAAAVRDDSFPATNSGHRASARKIRGACKIARSQGLNYLWSDTCCIDKDSSEELRRALNSMFAWYSEATVCYTYLFDVSSSHRGNQIFMREKQPTQSNSKPSEWFERGWTLQELLAPRKMEFYDKEWKFMGTRDHLAALVSEITGIDSGYLQDSGSRSLKFREASIATKFSWQAGRTTRDVEDIAYSLLGVLNVNMTPMYGEGIKAFARLQETLMADAVSFDESLFAWARPDHGDLRCYRRIKRNPGSPTQTIELIPKFDQTSWGLLAPSPDCFRATRNVIILRNQLVPRLGAGFQRTHQGVCVGLPLKETKSKVLGLDRKEIGLVLNCWGPEGAVVIQLFKDSQGLWVRPDCTRCETKRGAKVGTNRSMGIDQGSFLIATVTVAQPQLQLNYPG